MKGDNRFGPLPLVQYLLCRCVYIVKGTYLRYGHQDYEMELLTRIRDSISSWPKYTEVVTDWTYSHRNVPALIQINGFFTYGASRDTMRCSSIFFQISHYSTWQRVTLNQKFAIDKMFSQRSLWSLVVCTKKLLNEQNKVIKLSL